MKETVNKQKLSSAPLLKKESVKELKSKEDDFPIKIKPFSVQKVNHKVTIRTLFTRSL